MKKIALEEHFMAPQCVDYEGDVQKMMDQGAYARFKEGLADFDELRLQVMDQAGIEICVLSQTAPGLQAERDSLRAVDRAREINDFLAKHIAKHPRRFAGFAHLPMQDAKSASAELRRCVRELGFCGALINGHTNGVYLDSGELTPFWETVAELDVPVYLHPANSFDVPHMFDGYPVLRGPLWGWTCETACHALRLIISGLFDRMPTLKVILGHMGEALPFMLWRLDSRWEISKRPAELKKPLSQYVRDNFVITTAGVCDVPPLLCSIDSMGIDNVLFSTDYPYESAVTASEFIERAPISDEAKEKICFANAQRLLKLHT